MNVGERIRTKREELGLTQEELAKKLGYKSRSSVNKMENSRELPLKKISTMAKILNCSPTYLMGWENDTNDDGMICIKNEPLDIPFEEDPFYRLDDETARIAQAIKDNDNILFDAYKSTNKEKLVKYAAKLMELERMENGEDY